MASIINTGGFVQSTLAVKAGLARWRPTYAGLMHLDTNELGRVAKAREISDADGRAMFRTVMQERTETARWEREVRDAVPDPTPDPDDCHCHSDPSGEACPDCEADRFMARIEMEGSRDFAAVNPRPVVYETTQRGTRWVVLRDGMVVWRTSSRQAAIDRMTGKARGEADTFDRTTEVRRPLDDGTVHTSTHTRQTVRDRKAKIASICRKAMGSEQNSPRGDTSEPGRGELSRLGILPPAFAGFLASDEWDRNHARGYY